jgi:hypothetical protein
MSETTPEHLIPRLGNLPVSSTRYYQTATITRIRTSEQARRPVIDPFDPFRIPLVSPGTAYTGKIAEGILLTHQQGWYIAGTALGSLLHSVCLAPGEIVQIAVRNRTRSVLESSVDNGLQQEVIDRKRESSGTLSENETASAKETTSGSSTASASSSSNQVGVSGLLGGLGVSGGVGTNSAISNQASFSVGNRSIAEDNNQAVHQQASDQAQLARARHGAAIREVSESDSLELKTRVLANYNHMHALTMQYYEVEQVYQLRTKVTDAERLLFVPMRQIDFRVEHEVKLAIQFYREELVDTARELGLTRVAAKLSVYGLSDEQLAVEKSKLNKQLEQLEKELKDLKGTIAKFRKEIYVAEDHVLEARDTLREAEDVGLAQRAKLQRNLTFATIQAKNTKQEFIAEKSKLESLQQAADQAQAIRRDLQAGSSIDDSLLFALMYKDNLAFNQGLWMRLDPSVTLAILKRIRVDNHQLLGPVDPNPVAVSGSYLGFRWAFQDLQEASEFKERYLNAGELEQSTAVATGGIFGEAVLGESNAAEKIDLTRFWNWSDALPPIQPTEIAALEVPDTQPLQTPTLPNTPASAIDLGDITFPELSSGIPSITGALANPELFKDMSGSKTAAALAKSALELSAKGASEAAQLASKNYERFLAFQREAASALLDVSQQGNVDPTLAGGALNAQQEKEKSNGKTDSATEPTDDDSVFEVIFEADDTDTDLETE